MGSVGQYNPTPVPNITGFWVNISKELVTNLSLFALKGTGSLAVRKNWLEESID